MAQVKFGLFSIAGDAKAVMANAVRAERDGFFSFSPNDHFFSPFGKPSDPQLECFTMLAAIAAKTERIRLVPAVVAASFRNPALLAKITTTLDLVSDGRFTLGLGSGWLPTEYHAHNYPFPPTRERLEQMAEVIQVVKAMWTEERPSFTGRYFKIDGAYNQPRPVQRPHPPIMLGGSGTRLLELAAQHADAINLIPPTGKGKDFPNDPEATRKFDMGVLKQRIGLLERFTKEAGRDPEAIEKSGLALIHVTERADAPELTASANALGFPDLATAQRAPVALFGSAEQVCEELRLRVEETGIRSYIVAPTSPESLERFVAGVMPEFR